MSLLYIILFFLPSYIKRKFYCVPNLWLSKYNFLNTIPHYYHLGLSLFFPNLIHEGETFFFFHISYVSLLDHFFLSLSPFPWSNVYIDECFRNKFASIAENSKTNNIKKYGLTIIFNSPCLFSFNVRTSQCILILELSIVKRVQKMTNSHEFICLN